MKPIYVILIMTGFCGVGFYLYDRHQDNKLRKQFESLKGTEWEKLGEAGIKNFGL